MYPPLFNNEQNKFHGADNAFLILLEWNCVFGQDLTFGEKRVIQCTVKMQHPQTCLPFFSPSLSNSIFQNIQIQYLTVSVNFVIKKNDGTNCIKKCYWSAKVTLKFLSTDTTITCLDILSQDSVPHKKRQLLRLLHKMR
jgi:hypothetical protein